MIACLLSACAGMTTDDTIEAKPEVVQTLNRYTREYSIFPGDALEIAMYRNEGLAREVIVRADGRISLPMLDDIHVEGMTVSELDEHLTKRYSERLVNPEVTVIVKNPQEPMVYVFGEVKSAQPIPLRKAKTAAQAIAYAGDMKKSGKLNKVSVVRLNENGHLMSITIEAEASGQPGFYMALQNMPLQSGDLILVPESIRYQGIRALNDSLGAINQILTPYFQYRLLEEVIRRNDALLP